MHALISFIAESWYYLNSISVYLILRQITISIYSIIRLKNNIIKRNQNWENQSIVSSDINDHDFNAFDYNIFVNKIQSLKKFYSCFIW